MVRIASGKRRASSRDSVRRVGVGAAPGERASRRFEREIVAAQTDGGGRLASRFRALADHRVRYGVLRAVQAGQFGEVRLARRRDAPAKLLVRFRDTAAEGRYARLPVGRPRPFRFREGRVQLARHRRRVVVDKRQDVGHLAEARCDRSLAARASSSTFLASSNWFSAVSVAHEIQPGREEPGIESYGFAKRRDRLLILPERPRRAPEAVERDRFSRIRGRPGSGKLESLVPRLSGIAVVAPRDEVPFAFTHAVPQFEGPARPLRRECRLPGVGVRAGELRHGRGQSSDRARWPVSGAESTRGAGR